jgi:hypothetical protein
MRAINHRSRTIPARRKPLRGGAKTRWPRPSLMAIDIRSIPPMSDEPERVFSGARRTVSWDRGQRSRDY